MVKFIIYLLTYCLLQLKGVKTSLEPEGVFKGFKKGTVGTSLCETYQGLEVIHEGE